MATMGWDSTTGVGGVTSATTVQHWLNYEHPGESLVAAANEVVHQVGFWHEGSTPGQLEVGVYRKDTLELVGSAVVDGSGGAGRKTAAVNFPLVEGVEYIPSFRVVSTVSQYRGSAAGSYGRYSAATGATPLQDPFAIGSSSTHRYAVFAITRIALNVLIVHGSSTTGALAMQALLEGRGDTVTVVDDGALPGDVSAYDAIILADTAAGTSPTLLSTAKGMVLVGPDEWIAYGLTSANSAGAGQTAVEVKSTSHAISVALGWSTLDALITVATGVAGVARANPGTLGAGGTRIADDSTTTDGRVVLFAYDTGAALVSGNAAGRRVGWGHETPAEWTSTGNNVLFAAVDWVAAVAAPAAITGTGAPAAIAAAIAGVAHVGRFDTNAPALTVAAPALTGTGTVGVHEPQEYTGTGVLAATPETVVGAGTRGTSDQGGDVILQVQTPTVVGAGTVAPPGGGTAINGSGALAVGVQTLTGAGARGHAGTGAITSSVPTVSGTYVPIEITGIGALSVKTPLIAGTDVVGSTGNGGGSRQFGLGLGLGI